MRKFLIAFLLASAAATAATVADRPSRNANDPVQNRVQQSRSETTGTRRAPPSRTERPVLSRPPARTETIRVQTPRPNVETPARVQRVERHSQPVTLPADISEGRRINRPPNTNRRRTPVISRVPRIGTEPPARVEGRRAPQPRWSSNWRTDRRYDWRGWRQSHQQTFRLGRYRDPFGWARQVFTIGWRLWPAYYGSTYWINDPWVYRLPPAAPGTRWIRYYNDALLVDMWTGEVIDVIPGVFW